MDCVEADGGLQARGYARPLHYTVDHSLADPAWPFRYVFDQGSLRCSQAAAHKDRICYVARETETVLAKQRPSFVYLDVGCWADSADGEGKRCRDFGLVCGPNVYLCEYVDRPSMPPTRVPAVREFFASLARAGRGVRVNAYARARDVDDQTLSDPELYLLLGDLHLPPVTWFYSLDTMVETPPVEPPSWLARLPAMVRQTDGRLRCAWSAAAFHRSLGAVPKAEAYFVGNPDISRHAGDELVTFLHALTSVAPEVRAKLHFIHLGDMFELWVGRKYQLRPGPDGMPVWRFPNSCATVADWCLEVMIQNAPVFSAFRRLEAAGLAEVRYLSGNHDGYLLHPELPAQLDLPARQASYRGLNGDLLVEHGHRFDRWNFDSVDGRSILSGPYVSRVLMADPLLRTWEGALGKVSQLVSPRQRDVHVLGATLAHLDELIGQKRKPFSVYAMGHTHERMLVRSHLRAEYTTTNNE